MSKIHKITTIALGSFATLVPTIAGAQALGGNATLRDVAIKVVGYLDLAIYLIMALAFLYFVWNVFNYFFVADTNKTEAGKYVLYSIIGFAVILTFWGLVQLLIATAGLSNTQGALTAPINNAVNGSVNKVITI